MKAIKITYWTSTVIIALMMFYSAFSYMTNPMLKQAFVHLGFPDYFRIELAVAKIIGAALLLLPLRTIIKEWAYAGFTITFISAFIGHTIAGDPMQMRMMPLIFLITLAVSYFAYHKVQVTNRLPLPVTTL